MDSKWSNPKVRKFLKEIRRNLREHRVAFEWGRGEHCICPVDGGCCEGFFVKPNRKNWGLIRVAHKDGMSRVAVLHAVAHEVAHFLYWTEGDPFDGSSIYKDEAYTERRALKLMVDAGLPVDPERAKRASDSYLSMLRENP